MYAASTANQPKRSLESSLKHAIGLPLLAAGIDPRKMLCLRYLPTYLSDRKRFKRAGGNIANYLPIFSDFGDAAGTAKGHYFHQDLLVASFIAKACPVRHIDIGSRIDGFVAHVASFREIEVLDVRDLQRTGHENIKFVKADLMVDDPNHHEAADSVSCLHVIEHFGLGRYGDSIDPNGHLTGFENMAKMPKIGGTLYISFPIGTATRVCFNAHRVFHPREILDWPGHDRLELIRFDYVDDNGELHVNFPLTDRVPVTTFGCGIYTFRKHS